MKTHSVVDSGVGSTISTVECAITNGLPSISIVGLANKSVDEAKERIRNAFSSSNMKFPKKRVVINLAPADIPKDGTSHDLAIACAVLLSDKQINTIEDKTVFIGELGLDGVIHPVRGIIGKLLIAKNRGMETAFVPNSNSRQAALIDGIKIIPIRTLSELYLHLTNTKNSPVIKHIEEDYSNNVKVDSDFLIESITGQENAKRALQIAAAGKHNILLNGPPGTGKSMLAKSLISILPGMSLEEVLQTTQIHSLIGGNYDKLIKIRPFRSPHHSASDTAVIGGGTNPKPGEISLAHNGVLLFDEFPEFKRNALEALRQPLEEGSITISRSKDTVRYPADFLFVATANPCPCGYFGSQRGCICTSHQIVQYQRKLSGPIIDRIDLYVEVENIPHKRLLSKSSSGITSSEIRSIVKSAWHTQQKR